MTSTKTIKIDKAVWQVLNYHKTHGYNLKTYNDVLRCLLNVKDKPTKQSR